ncbi:MAG: radical SAM protein [Nitrososphaerota archaeon]|nr:radical SAM protein [Candidatus Bathyarchaeota archaeon]MDW8049349.1 radical SAM protein [Nitrososphaerota archaeon]
MPKPVSAGIILSYTCTCECKHCMYACSPKWKDGWINTADAEKIIKSLSGTIQVSPFGRRRVSINYGLHFTGGEPFLNFNLLVKLVRIASKFNIPSTFVETNSFWSMDDSTARSKMIILKDAGLDGILVSVNPFILEHIPFDRTLRTIRLAREVFGDNVIVYQEMFLHQFMILGVKGTLRLEEYLKCAGPGGLTNVELLPMGRACYKLAQFFRKFKSEVFFHESCLNELTRQWHVHIDCYGNFIPGYCGGLSLGNVTGEESLCREIDLDKHPIIACLLSTNGLEKLYRMAVNEFDYRSLPDGYISKCHLCVDIRKHISLQTSEFLELRPKEFYENL